MNPFEQFKNWFKEENTISNLKLPAACCLSTLGLDGYPNSRFVSLKEVMKDTFIITGSLDSRKGQEIDKYPKVALSFWWAGTERQVRIQGDTTYISKLRADHYFKQRNRDSQIISSVFRQGEEAESIEAIQHHFRNEKMILKDDVVERPKNWSGIAISPNRIEFMDFKESRLHERQLYVKNNDSWIKTILQP